MSRAYDMCRTCGEWAWLGSHTCPPQWLVLEADADDRWEWARPVHARSAEAAAEKWARRHDEGGDYDIVSGSPATVLVRPHDEPDAEPVHFEVTGESVPEYHAREVER